MEEVIAMKCHQERRTLSAVVAMAAMQGPLTTKPSVAASILSTDENNNQQTAKVRRR